MVFVVLAAFAAGCAMGMLALLPGWWRGRTVLRGEALAQPPEAARQTRPPAGLDSVVPESRLREGL